MSVARYWSDRTAEILVRHPNEMDLQRIRRALNDRQRYRYVVPKVSAVDQGYLVRSACCSRTVDPDGGVVDVARLHWNEDLQEWRLFRKDHLSGEWVSDSRHARLSDLFLRLNTDPDRQFWQ